MSDYAIDDLVWQPVSGIDLKQRLERLLEFQWERAAAEESLHLAEGC